MVDAGGTGFMRMIEGGVRFIEGDPILPAPPAEPTSYAFPAAEMNVEDRAFVRWAELHAAEMGSGVIFRGHSRQGY